MHLLFILAAFIIILVFGMEFVRKFGGLLMLILAVLFLVNFVAGSKSIGHAIGSTTRFAIRSTEGILTGITEGNNK